MKQCRNGFQSFYENCHRKFSSHFEIFIHLSLLNLQNHDFFHDLIKANLEDINRKIKRLLTEVKITSVWKLNGKYLTPEDEKQENINTFHKRFCSECQTQTKSSDPCKKIEVLNQIKCGFKSIYKTLWQIVDSGNATCTQCGLFIINDSGFCPDCHTITKKQWKQVKIKMKHLQIFIYNSTNHFFHLFF